MPPAGQAPGRPWGDPHAWNAASVAPATRPEQPASIRNAVLLMYVGAGLTILSAIIFFSMYERLADSMADANPYYSRGVVDRAVERAQTREIVRTAVGVALWVWMAIKNGQGRRWARVVATVFGVIDLLGMAYAGLVYLSAEDDVDLVLGYYEPLLVLAGLVSVLAVVILAQLYRESSSRYYDDSTRWKAAATLRRGYY